MYEIFGTKLTGMAIGQMFVEGSKTGLKYQQDARSASIQRANAHRQASLNNQLNYNSHSNLNSQQQLEFKKFGLDDFQLQKQIRRERAFNAVVQASMGGVFGRSGASKEATQLNIERHGFEALVRKDFNFKNTLNNFSIKHSNIDLNTLSANNKAFSNLDSGPNALGSALEFVGTGLQITTNA